MTQSNGNGLLNPFRDSGNSTSSSFVFMKARLCINSKPSLNFIIYSPLAAKAPGPIFLTELGIST